MIVHILDRVWVNPDHVTSLYEEDIGTGREPEYQTRIYIRGDVNHFVRLRAVEVAELLNRGSS